MNLNGTFPIFEKRPPGVIVNNEFVFCELGWNISYFEKCPPGVIVNTEFFFFSVNFSGGQSNN